MASTMRFDQWQNTVGTKSVTTDEVSAVSKGVANQAERNTLYPSPVQGNTVFRTDLGTTETYFGVYNSSTNPGGQASAGWYPAQTGGLVPLKPTSVDLTGDSGRTATVSSTGLVTFSGNCITVSLNGVLSDKYKSYRMMVTYAANNGDNVYMRTRSNGTDGGTYFRSGMLWYTNSTGSYWGGYGESLAYLCPTGTANQFSIVTDFTPSGGMQSFATGQSGGTLVNAAVLSYFAASGDGITLGLSNSAGRFNGNIQIYGYRN